MHTCAIDIHHHYLPPGLVEELKAHGKAVGAEVGATPEGLTTLTIGRGPSFVVPPPLMDVHKRIENMDEGRIALATLEPHTACLGYRLDPERGETWCNLYNQGLMELRDRRPDRFTALAAAPLQDPVRAARVLERGMLDSKLAGAYIGTNVNGEYFRGREYDAFWGKAQELDALIVMHPEDIAGLERMAPYGLFLICGNPADTALSLGFLTYSGVFDRFPDLRLCVLHGGGFFPYHLGRFDQGYGVRPGAADAEARERPSAYLKNLYSDTLVYRVDTLEYLKGILGWERLMVGTDYPYPLGDWKAVEKVEALACSDEQKLAILEGNARRLLKLGPAAG